MRIHWKPAFVSYWDAAGTPPRSDGSNSVKNRQCWRVAWNALERHMPPGELKAAALDPLVSAELCDAYFRRAREAQAAGLAAGLADRKVLDLEDEVKTLGTALAKARELYQEQLAENLRPKFAGRPAPTTPPRRTRQTY